MDPQEQLSLPGFRTIKKLRRHNDGMLELQEYDAAQWKRHEADLDGRLQALPKRPRLADKAAYEAWRQQAQEKMEQPLPTIKPVQVWPLGHYNGANVLPYLQDKKECLTPADIHALKEYLMHKEAVAAQAEAKAEATLEAEKSAGVDHNQLQLQF